MKRSIYFFLFIGFFLVSSQVLTSCKKYEDGPALSFRSPENRVTQDWQVLSISRNDIDIDSEFDYMYLNFKDNEVFEWIFKRVDNPDEERFEGSNPVWEMATLDDQIKITYTNDDLGEERLLYFDIQRLTKDELWLNYIDNGDNMRLRMSPR